MSVDHFTKLSFLQSTQWRCLDEFTFAIHKPTPTRTENADKQQAVLPVPSSPNTNFLHPQSLVPSDRLLHPLFTRTQTTETTTSMAHHFLNCPVQAEPHDWECSTCGADYEADVNVPISLPWYQSDGSMACYICIRSRFQEALHSGVIWPARWGSIHMEVQHYRQILDDKLYGAYMAKEQAKAKAGPPKTPVVPDGLTQGKDVQICPNPMCKKLISLRSGCNHIVCEACQQSFCFICGKEAYDGTDHWTRDCPRYNARGSARAQYDPQPRPQAAPHQQDLALDGDDIVMTRPSITNWNVAMQTSNLETRNLLRFLDASGPAITEAHRQ
jgi:hypothetical protein